MASAEKWFTRFKTAASARLRLFCFHHAGAGASAYRVWPSLLPDTVELWAVQLPGRENRFRDSRFESLPPLIAELIRAFAALDDLPCALFGHSLGALVAFELARALPRPPAHLFLSGRRAIHLPEPRLPLSHLPDDRFIAALRELQGTPDAIFASDELRQLLLPVLRSDFALAESHTPAAPAPLSSPLTVLGGEADPWTDREGLDLWRRHTSATFRLRPYPGDHFFVVSQRDAVVADLLADLAPLLG